MNGKMERKWEKSDETEATWLLIIESIELLFNLRRNGKRNGKKVREERRDGQKQTAAQR